MRVVALISGGKDSCYNMLQCVAAGHDVVALANLCPENKDELDSYMYQTVGHHAIQLYAEALDLPLYRRITKGIALNQGPIYSPTLQDEVEDLYQLLKIVKDEVEVDAVAVGAIFSDYQRVRVENVCKRLGLTVLAFLWRRDQAELLQEMIDCEIDAIVIKVAALGLEPSKHLGKSIKEMQPHLIKMKEKYGLNVCGEGGEYETFTLDCPLFKKSIVIDDWEAIAHTQDTIAPVGYITFNSFHLVDKEVNVSMDERLKTIPIKSCVDFLSDMDESLDQTQSGEDEEEEVVEEETSEGQRMDYIPSPSPTPTLTNHTGWCWIGGILGKGKDSAEATAQALIKLQNALKRQKMSPVDVVAVSLYVADMDKFSEINAEYSQVFGDNFTSKDAVPLNIVDSISQFSILPPPARVCVEVPLPPGEPILLEALAYRHECRSEGSEGDSDAEDATSGIPGWSRQAMHVQGISHWAPANIGPYSQAVRIGDIIYVAGQIALVPGTMQMVSGGIQNQCRLALRHIGRIVKAIDPKTELRDVVQGICYVTHPSYIPKARKEWEKRTNNAIVDYVVIPRLPRQALVEWHIWAHRHNNTFDYEETGCHIHDDVKVSIRRRWNYESTVAAIVCYLSPGFAEDSGGNVEVNENSLVEALCYMLRKLLQDAPSLHSSVCSLRVFYKVDGFLNPVQLHEVMRRCELVSGFSIVHIFIPVCQLHNKETFLSVCGVRHE